MMNPVTEADVLVAFQEFYNALTGSEARDVLRAHPALLTEEGLTILRRTRDAAADAAVREALDTARTILEGYKERWESSERELGAFVTITPIAAALRAIRQVPAEFGAAGVRDLPDMWDGIVDHPGFALSSLRFRLMAFNNAAHAHRRRHEQLGRGGDGGDINRAVALAERAIDALPANSFEGAVHIDALAVSLLDRYRHSRRPQDLERSIQVCTDFIASPPPDPRDLADTWSNLGHALIERSERVPGGADLAAAVDAYERAVGETRPEAANFRVYFNNLGEAVRQLFLATRSRDHLEHAIRVCEQAVTHAGDDTMSSLKAMTNLANVLLDRYELPDGRDERDLERGLALLRQAHDAAADGSHERAVIANSLASVAYFAARQASDRTDLEEEIERMEQAIGAVSADAPEYLPFLYNAGNLLREQYKRTQDVADLDRSIEHWDRACSLLRATFAEVPVDYKLGQQHKWTALHRQLVLAYLEQAKDDPPRKEAALQRAMVVTEAWKARLLTELVGRGHLAAPGCIAAQAVRERELLAELTTLDNAEVAGPERASMAGRLDRLRRREESRQELERLWTSMAACGPDAAEYVAVRRADELGWDDLSRLAGELGAETVLISHLIAGSRTLLFMMRAGWPAPRAVDVDVDEQAGSALLRRLFEEVYEEPPDPAAVSETWLGPLKELFARAAADVEGAARVVFVPGASGYLIPWAVVADRAGWRRPDGGPMPIATMPSLAALPRLRKRVPLERGRPLIVGDPRGDMVYAGDEAGDLASRLHVRPLIGSRATAAAIRTRLSKASIAHFATHAYFVSGSPLDSGLRLADRDLTAREVMTIPLGADLVVLSACETGRAEPLAGDEVAGLPTALLQAGARTVLVSLWPVSGLATATIMSAFYDAWTVRRDKAIALADAMAALRDGAWPHPCYWGAFILVGDWS